MSNKTVMTVLMVMLCFSGIRVYSTITSEHDTFSEMVDEDELLPPALDLDDYSRMNCNDDEVIQAIEYLYHAHYDVRDNQLLDISSQSTVRVNNKGFTCTGHYKFKYFNFNVMIEFNLVKYNDTVQYSFKEI